MQMSENMHFSTTGLALTPDEVQKLEADAWEFTGWYNQHGQPIVRNKNTHEELSFCRMNYIGQISCNTCVQGGSNGSSYRY